jgi:hypothetical protein
MALVALATLAGCSLIDAAGDGAAGRDGSPDAAVAAGDAAPGCVLRDDFEDGQTGALWQPFNDTDARVREAAGYLEITFNDSPDSWAGYQLAQPIDLTSGEVRIEVKAAGGVYTGLEVCFEEMELEIYAEDVETLIGAVSGTPIDDDSDEIPYDSAAHIVWRIRTDAGDATWEVSTDGDTWDTIHTQSAPFPLDAVTVLIEAGGGLGDPAAAIESFSATPTGCAE